MMKYLYIYIPDNYNSKLGDSSYNRAGKKLVKAKYQPTNLKCNNLLLHLLIPETRLNLISTVKLTQ